MNTKLLLLVLTTFFLTSCSRKMGGGGRGETTKPIAILDLQPLLKYDYNNAAQLKSAWDILHATSTLQGIVNRNQPNFYIKYVVTNNLSIDDYWWNKYREPGKWLSTKNTKQLSNIYDVLDYFKSYVNGLVVYDPNVASTSNLASSIAGIENLVAVRYDDTPNSLYKNLLSKGFPVKVRLLNPDGTSMFTGKGMIPEVNLPSTGSAKNDAYRWFIEKYLKTGKCNTEFAGYYIDQYWMKKPAATVPNHHTLTNHDFFVSKKAFFFDLSPWGDEPATDEPGQPAGVDLETLKIMLRQAYQQNRGQKFLHIGGFPAWAFKYTKHANGKHDDVPTEWEFSEIISAYNAFKDADAIGYGAMANASFWAHFPLKNVYPQTKTTIQNLKGRSYLNSDGAVNLQGKDYIVFYVGDYDASAWVYQTAPFIWDDANRGKVPMMWAISPVLERRAPMVLHYMRETATKNDYFVAADNGAGYLNPGMLQSPRPVSGLPDGVDAWANHNIPFYKRWDLSITGFIIDGNTPAMNDNSFKAYARFSKDGIVPQKMPLTLLKYDMPILRSDDDVMANNPADAATHVASRVQSRNIPFHWFRNILKTPTWYMNVHEQLKIQNPKIELLDGSSFFLLYKQYLLQNPDAAAGRIQ